MHTLIYNAPHRDEDEHKWAVGFFNPQGEFVSIDVLTDYNDALNLVCVLNGGINEGDIRAIRNLLEEVKSSLDGIANEIYRHGSV